MPKNFFATLLVLLMLLTCLTACNSEESVTPPDLSGDIALSGSVDSGNVKAELSLSRSDGVWTAKFSSPENIKGLTVICDNNSNTVEYSGIKFQYKNEEVPFTTAVQYLTSVIDAAAKTDSISVKPTADGTEISGTAENSGYIMKVSYDGAITEIKSGGFSFACGDKQTSLVTEDIEGAEAEMTDSSDISDITNSTVSSAEK